MKLLKYILIAILISCKGPTASSYKDRNMIAGSLTKTDSLLIYATWDSYIVIENILTDRKLHEIKIQDNCFAKPLLKDNKLYFPTSNKQFSCYDLTTKKIIWNCEIRGTCMLFKLLKNRLIINEKDYGISALNILSGKKEFELNYIYNEKCSIPDLSPYYIVCNEDNFYVCNWQCKTITAFDGLTGKEVWNKSFGSAVSNAVVINNYIFMGFDNMYKGGKIYLLDSKTGNILFEQGNKFQVRFNPIQYKNDIYFYSYDNKLNKFDVSNKSNKVIYSFDNTNSPGGDQMFLLDNYLYYSAGDPMFIYRFNLNNNTLDKIQEADKSIYGVYKKADNKIEFIY